MSDRGPPLTADALLDMFLKDGDEINRASLQWNPMRRATSRPSASGDNTMVPSNGARSQPVILNGIAHNPTGSNTQHVTDLMRTMAISRNKRTTKSVIQSGTSANPKEENKATLANMPLDLLFEILDHLPLSSIIALSLTSKSMRDSIGAHLDEELRKPENKAQLWEFLSLIDKELPGHRTCQMCETMHVRSPIDTFADWHWVALRRRNTCSVKSGEIVLAPTISFSFEEVQLVMRSHRYSSLQHGLPLDTLVRRHHSGSVGLPVQHIKTRARISKRGELIIERRETMTLPTAGFLEHRFENNQLIARVPFDFSSTNLSPCKHRDRILTQETFVATKIMCRLYHRSAHHENPSLCRICGPIRQRCGACETEWEIDPGLTWQNPDSTNICLITWQNLGECKTAFDRKWQRHLRSTRWSWVVTQQDREQADGPLLEYCRTPDLSPRMDYHDAPDIDIFETMRFPRR